MCVQDEGSTGCFSVGGEGDSAEGLIRDSHDYTSDRWDKTPPVRHTNNTLTKEWD